MTVNWVLKPSIVPAPKSAGWATVASPKLKGPE
jgi:hypothetical protein